MVWETHEVREETNQSVRLTSPTPPAPTNVENTSGRAPPTYAPHTTHGSLTTPTPIPASTIAPVPAIQPLTSVRRHPSMDARNCGSSADMLCNEVVGVPRHLLLQTNASIYGPGQSKVDGQCGVERPNGCSIDPEGGRDTQCKVDNAQRGVEWPNAESTNPTWARISRRLHLLACKSELEVDLWHFDSVRTTSTSLICKSEPEVDCSRVSTLLPPTCTPHLPRMQERAGGGFYMA